LFIVINLINQQWLVGFTLKDWRWTLLLPIDLIKVVEHQNPICRIDEDTTIIVRINRTQFHHVTLFVVANLINL
jgi:hypothetical protein